MSTNVLILTCGSYYKPEEFSAVPWHDLEGKNGQAQGQGPVADYEACGSKSDRPCGKAPVSLLILY